MAQNQTHIRPVRFHQALRGLPYPATKKEIRRYVRNSGTDNGVYDRIRDIADKTYRNESEILTELEAFDPHVVSRNEGVYESITVPRYYRPRTRSLVVAAGRQGARIYAISGEAMLLVGSFKVPSYRYSDAEGHFKARFSGNTARSGAERELDWRDMEKQFLRDLAHYFRRINPRDFDQIYVFVPSYVKKDLMGVFPAQLQQRVVRVADRNYYSFHPLELLKKIQMFEESNAPERYQEPQQFLYT